MDKSGSYEIETVMRTMAMNVMNKVNNIMNNCNGDENSGEINGIILKNKGSHCQNCRFPQ